MKGFGPLDAVKLNVVRVSCCGAVVGVVVAPGVGALLLLFVSDVFDTCAAGVLEKPVCPKEYLSPDPPEVVLAVDDCAAGVTLNLKTGAAIALFASSEDTTGAADGTLSNVDDAGVVDTDVIEVGVVEAGVVEAGVVDAGAVNAVNAGIDVIPFDAGVTGAVAAGLEENPKLNFGVVVACAEDEEFDRF